ncbi:MAG: hypothetical protein WDA02_08765 [Saccharofermentanales bacterium]
MEICKICKKEFKTKQGLNSHMGYHSNPNRKSNFSDYNRKIKNGELSKINSNQFIKAKNEGKKIEVSEETRKKLSIASKKQKWSEERRKKHSESMTKAVEENPLSYSANNVCGRTKLIKYKETKLNGKWELEVAKWLDINNIKWTNIINGFNYEWNGKIHKYFPDFYLTDFNIYIEVKGYQRDRDIQKWKSLSNLIVLKKQEIKLIKDNKLSVDILKNNGFG